VDFATVVHSYGGPVLFVWAWLQGEAAVIVGGSLAAQGYWPWWAVWLVGVVPATVGHQLCAAPLASRPLRFFRYNLGTGLAWALVFTWVGYAFGVAATAAFGRVAHYGTWVLASSVAVGLAIHLPLQRWGRRLT